MSERKDFYLGRTRDDLTLGVVDRKEDVTTSTRGPVVSVDGVAVIVTGRPVAIPTLTTAHTTTTTVTTIGSGPRGTWSVDGRPGVGSGPPIVVIRPSRVSTCRGDPREVGPCTPVRREVRG